MPSINPYLNFDGDCEDAFDFYQSVFGGELVDKTRFSELPDEMPADEADADKIMHVALPLGDDQWLMGSDRPASMSPGNVGDNVQVNVSPDSEPEAKRIFQGLSEGGTVTMPLQRMFWGADFGMCTDKYGINWMVNYSHE